LDARAPFRIGDFVYEATIADDGSSISLARSTKAAAQLTTDSLPPASPAPSASEPIVPNFSALAWGGGAIGPADFRGKILILDFWATWCGPCQKSMPHIERVYEAARNKNVAVLAVCVWDDKASCNNWMRTNLSKYSFTLAFDPAGKDNGNSIARKLFKVTGIPTTIVIDAEGHIAETIVGYSDGDTRLESALKKLGVDL
jgi:thiol-disulfide isomerase/thioredoxin